MLQAEIIGDIYDLQEVASMIDNTTEDVELTINSPGGSALEGMNLARSIVARQDVVVTAKIKNVAASAAAVIALSCPIVEITKYDMLVLHHCWSISIGNKEEMQQEIDAMKHIDQILEEYLTQYCSEEDAEILKARMAEGDVFLSGEEAAEMFSNVELVEVEAPQERQNSFNFGALAKQINASKAENIVLNNEKASLTAKVAELEKQVKDLTYAVPEDVQAIINEVL